MPCILGRKLQMTQLFLDDGTVVPVTMLKVEPNVVTRVRKSENGSFVQIGTDQTKRLNKPEAGHLKDLPLLRTLKEVFFSETQHTRGDRFDVGIFEPGMKIHVTGITKGKGFAGVVKRHGFKGSKATHGNKDQLRMPGSIGSQMQAPPMKGKRMAGRMGGTQVTVKNLEVISIDGNNHTMAVKGAVPGAFGSLVFVQSSDTKTIWQP